MGAVYVSGPLRGGPDATSAKRGGSEARLGVWHHRTGRADFCLRTRLSRPTLVWGVSFVRSNSLGHVPVSRRLVLLRIVRKNNLLLQCNVARTAVRSAPRMSLPKRGDRKDMRRAKLEACGSASVERVAGVEAILT